MATKKILIIGSEGFIGSHLTQYFLNENCELVGCDLFEAPRRLSYTYHKVSRLSPEWETLLSTIQPDICINAGGSGNVQYSISHPVADFEANTLDTVLILDAIRRYTRTCKYLHISSAAVYGNPSKLPVTEQSDKSPLSPYGWHKLMSEQVCQEYFDLYKISIAIIRPFSVYGGGLQKQLLWDICNKLKDHPTTELFGTGQESRDFIHITDLIALIGCIIDKATFQMEIFNAASGIESTVRTVADIFETYYRHTKKITFSGKKRIGDPLQWRADISKISALGFKPSINLSDGISDFISWFESLSHRP